MDGLKGLRKIYYIYIYTHIYDRLSLAVHTQTPRCNMHVRGQQNKTEMQNKDENASWGTYYLLRASLGIYCWSDISIRNKKVLPVAIRSRAMRQVTLQSFEQKKTWAKHDTPPNGILMGRSIFTNVFPVSFLSVLPWASWIHTTFTTNIHFPNLCCKQVLSNHQFCGCKPLLTSPPSYWWNSKKPPIIKGSIKIYPPQKKKYDDNENSQFLIGEASSYMVVFPLSCSF